MSLGRKLMQAYFDYAYNPIYDFTTARVNRYRELQKRCVDKFELEDNDKVLCVGLGTGNEILHILQKSKRVEIVGVDYSKTALRKACKKASELGKEIEGLVMDARYLEFAAGSFDKVLCIHVMDFIEESEKVTHEILRVLKDGGQFVITYPSDNEGVRLGLNLLKDSIRHNINSGKNSVAAFSQSVAQMLAGIVYLPILLRPKKTTYSQGKLEAMINKFVTGDFQIEEDPVYQDFIVYGKNLSKGG